MRLLALLPMLLIAAPTVTHAQDWSAQIAEWTQPAEPFRIAGNVYYVGTGGIAAYLITDPKGHVLIDAGLPESADAVAAHIRQLGFRVEDVRTILINHAHFDHAGGLARLKALTGAKLLASAADRPSLEAGKTIGRPDLTGFPRVKVDGVIGEGMHVRVGATDLVTHLTPGHTPGCTSWTLKLREEGKPLEALFACSITVAGQDLVGRKSYPRAAADYRATFAKLKRLHPDIYLSFHPGSFGMEEKRAKLTAGDRFAFVDKSELAKRVGTAEAAFEGELTKQRKAKRP